MKAFYAWCPAIFVSVAIGLTSAPSLLRGQNSAEAPKLAASPAGNADNGKRLFVRDGCYECHGREGQGAVTGPRLGPNPPPLEVIISYVRRPTGEMPPYTAKVVSDEELADIYVFLQTRPHPPDAKTIPLLR